MKPAKWGIYIFNFNGIVTDRNYHKKFDTKIEAQKIFKEKMLQFLSEDGFDDPDCPEYYELYEEIVTCFDVNDYEQAQQCFNDIAMNVDNARYSTIMTLVKERKEKCLK